MTELVGPVQVKELIIKQFDKLGYKEQRKTIETLNGPKEITEYTKSFLTYSFINPDGSGEYPLVLSIDFTKEDKLYGPVEDARFFIFQAIGDELTNTRQKTRDRIYGHDENFLVVDTNLEGLEHVEKVFEKLHIPGFNYRFDELRNSTQGKLLKELDFEVGIGKHNDLLVGDKPFIHVVHAPIKEGTKGKEGYAPYEWKAKIDAEKLMSDKRFIARYNEIINEYGLQSYKDGNSFITTKSMPRSNLIIDIKSIDKKNPGLQVIGSEDSFEKPPQEYFIVSRVNIPGLVKLSSLFESQ